MSKRESRPLIERLRGFMRIGRITMVDDSVAPQLVQIRTRAGETESDIPRYQPHGLRSIPVAGAQGVLFSFGGFRRNTLLVQADAGMLGEAYLQGGDVALDDYRGLVIHLSADGIVIRGNGMPVLITGTPKLRVEGAIEATGEVTAMVDGQAIPLSTHLNSGILSGGALSGPPRAP